MKPRRSVCKEYGESGTGISNPRAASPKRTRELGSTRTIVISVVCVVAIAAVGSFLYLQPERSPAAPPKKVVDVAAVKTKADAGDVQAQKELGDAYAEGNGVAQSFTEAAQWYRLAADHGNAAAAASLGMLYDVGQGVKRDESEAVKWYRKAAEQGDISGEYNLGLMYGAGRGVPLNAVEAARWHRLAAEQGDALAQYNVGKRYWVGKGVKQDFVEAFKWLTLASRQGIPDASELLREVKPQLSSADLAEANQRINAFTPKKASSASTQ